MNTSSMRSGESFARSTAAPMTCEPSLWALKGERSPWNLPSGVRAAETMTTGIGNGHGRLQYCDAGFVR